MIMMVNHGGVQETHPLDKDAAASRRNRRPLPPPPRVAPRDRIAPAPPAQPRARAPALMLPSLMLSPSGGTTTEVE